MTITLGVVLFISISVNMLLVWYCRRLTKQFLFFTENVGDLEESLGAFETHLTDIHELEMFYGDDTLAALISHSKQIVERIRDFYDGFSLDEEEEEEIDGTP